jgi:hypothetical protein
MNKASIKKPQEIEILKLFLDKMLIPSKDITHYLLMQISQLMNISVKTSERTHINV